MSENQVHAENKWMEEQFREIKRKLDDSMELLTELDKKFAVLNSEVQTHFVSDKNSFAETKEALSEMGRRTEDLSRRVWYMLGAGVVTGAIIAFIAGAVLK